MTNESCLTCYLGSSTDVFMSHTPWNHESSTPNLSVLTSSKMCKAQDFQLNLDAVGCKFRCSPPASVWQLIAMEPSHLWVPLSLRQVLVPHEGSWSFCCTTMWSFCTKSLLPKKPWQVIYTPLLGGHCESSGGGKEVNEGSHSVSHQKTGGKACVAARSLDKGIALHCESNKDLSSPKT